MKVLGKFGWNWREGTASDFSSERERESKIHRLAVPVLKSIQNLVISHRCCAAVVLKGVMHMQNCWFVDKPYCILTHLFFFKQTRDRSNITGAQSVVIFFLGRYFPSSYSWNKAKLKVSTAWWPLNRGLSSHSFLQLFRDFDYWPINRGLPVAA